MKKYSKVFSTLFFGVTFALTCVLSGIGNFFLGNRFANASTTSIDSIGSLDAYNSTDGFNTVKFGEYPQDRVLEVATNWTTFPTFSTRSTEVESTIKGYISTLCESYYESSSLQNASNPLNVFYTSDYNWNSTTISKFIPLEDCENSNIKFDYKTGYFTIKNDVYSTTDTTFGYEAGTKFYAYNYAVDYYNKLYGTGSSSSSTLSNSGNPAVNDSTLVNERYNNGTASQKGMNISGSYKSYNPTLVGTTYLFVVKPIEWQILKNESGILTLFSKCNLDSQIFDGVGNEWVYSRIRGWLNGEENQTYYNASIESEYVFSNHCFSDLAFTSNQLSLILDTTNSQDNESSYWAGETHYYTSGAATAAGKEQEDYPTSTEKLFLLSTDDISSINSAHRIINNTDYAVASGNFDNALANIISTTPSYPDIKSATDYGWTFTRTASSTASNYVQSLVENATTTKEATNTYGVVPAFRISEENLLQCLGVSVDSSIIKTVSSNGTNSMNAIDLDSSTTLSGTVKTFSKGDNTSHSASIINITSKLGYSYTSLATLSGEEDSTKTGTSEVYSVINNGTDYTHYVKVSYSSQIENTRLMARVVSNTSPTAGKTIAFNYITSDIGASGSGSTVFKFVHTTADEDYTIEIYSESNGEIVPAGIFAKGYGNSEYKTYYSVYVDNQNGSDKNFGNSAISPVKTIQKALDLVSKDTSSTPKTIYVMSSIDVTSDLEINPLGKITIKRYGSIQDETIFNFKGTDTNRIAVLIDNVKLDGQSLVSDSSAIMNVENTDLIFGSKLEIENWKYTYAGVSLNKSSLTINNGGTYSGNGLLLNYNLDSDITINGGTFNSNLQIIGRNSDASLSSKANVNISGGTFTGNGVLGGVTTCNRGSVAELDGGSLVVSGGTFGSNSSISGGGVFYINCRNNKICPVDIKNATFTSNTTGGQIKTSAESGSYDFDYTTAYTNVGGGGAIFSTQSTTIHNCTFTSNAFSSALTNIGANLGGGAVSINGERSSLSLNRCEFNGNSSLSYGGAVAVNTRKLTTALAPNSMTIVNCDFTSNNSGYGGAVYFNDTRDLNGNIVTSEIRDCLFSGNINANSGDKVTSLYIDSASARINIYNTTFTMDNTFAVVCKNDGIVSYYDCTFTKNYSTDAIIENGSFYSCIITNNSTVNGCTKGSTLYFSDIYENYATTKGGGLGNNTTAYNCEIHDNASLNGGGAYGSTCYTCNIYRNYATNNGGGLNNCSAYNCNIYKNYVLQIGGGAYGSSLIGCNVKNNVAESNYASVVLTEGNALGKTLTCYGNKTMNDYSENDIVVGPSNTTISAKAPMMTGEGDLEEVNGGTDNNVIYILGTVKIANDYKASSTNERLTLNVGNLNINNGKMPLFSYQNSYSLSNSDIENNTLNLKDVLQNLFTLELLREEEISNSATSLNNYQQNLYIKQVGTTNLLSGNDLVEVSSSNFITYSTALFAGSTSFTLSAKFRIPSLSSGTRYLIVGSCNGTNSGEISLEVVGGKLTVILGTNSVTDSSANIVANREYKVSFVYDASANHWTLTCYTCDNSTYSEFDFSGDWNKSVASVNYLRSGKDYRSSVTFGTLLVHVDNAVAGDYDNASWLMPHYVANDYVGNIDDETHGISVEISDTSAFRIEYSLDGITYQTSNFAYSYDDLGENHNKEIYFKITRTDAISYKVVYGRRNIIITSDSASVVRGNKTANLVGTLKMNGKLGQTITAGNLSSSIIEGYYVGINGIELAGRYVLSSDVSITTNNQEISITFYPFDLGYSAVNGSIHVLLSYDALTYADNHFYELSTSETALNGIELDEIISYMGENGSITFLSTYTFGTTTYYLLTDKNITIKRGSSNSGSIMNVVAGATVYIGSNEMKGSIVINGMEYAAHDALINNYGTLYITNNIEMIRGYNIATGSNTSYTQGGAIYNAGTAVLSFNKISIMRYSRGGGGAIYNSASGVLEINKTNANNCYGKDGGGFIYSLGTLKVNNCKIVNCYGWYVSSSIPCGMAINVNGGNAIISNSTIMECGVVDTATALIEPDEGQNGGAIYVGGSANCSIYSCEIASCYAYLGAGVYVAGKLTCSKTNFIRCTAQSDGAGVYALDGSKCVLISSYVIAGIIGNISATKEQEFVSEDNTKQFVVMSANDVTNGNNNSSTNVLIYIIGSLSGVILILFGFLLLKLKYKNAGNKQKK